EFRCCVEECAPAGEAGGVDDSVDAPKGGDRLGHRDLGLFDCGEIGADKSCSGSHLLQLTSERLAGDRVAAGHHYGLSALGRSLLGNGAAPPLRAATDQNDLALEPV